MQAKACDIAANTFERTPQVRDESVRIMQNRRLFADPLYEPNAGAKTDPRPSRARCNPRKREIGHQVIILVQSTHVAVTAREKHFLDLVLLGRLQRNVLEEATRLVTRDGMTRGDDVRRVTQIFNDRLGEAIRQYPEQYLWSHRRWRED